MALIKCIECGKEISDKAHSCPNCGCPVGQIKIDTKKEEFIPMPTIDAGNKNDNTKKKDSTLSIIAFIVTLLGCGYLSVIGLILAIIDLRKNDKEKQHGWSQAAIGLFCGWVFLWMVIFNGTNSNDEKDELTTEEITISEQITTQEATTEISEEEFKESAEEVSYEDVYRNPETYKNKPIKITVYVNEYDTQYLGLMDVYHCTVDGKWIFVSDYRDVKEPTIASGDTVVIYGTGAGMATLTEKQKNIIGITTNSEKTQIPSINMEYVEIK